MRTPLLAVLAVSLVGCNSGNPVSYSAPVGISLDVRSNAVTGGQVRVDKNVSTESGNPYGAFVNDAVKTLGHAPSRIVVTASVLTLDPAASSGVASLQQVLTGPVVVSFAPNGSSNVYPAATVTSPTGVGPVQMTVGFDSSTMTAGDYADLVGGSFKVVLSGQAASGFASLGATADITATLTFEAFP